MQVITSWAELKALSKPESLVSALLGHLIDPFSDEKNAIEFWNECPSTIFIFDSNDSVGDLEQLEESQKTQVQFAFNYPEYIEPLNDDYIISLTIMNDEGAGVYLVIHNQSDFIRLTR
ncbi:MAG TPA: hypothetical protein VIM93_00240 [Kangiella sp.]